MADHTEIIGRDDVNDLDAILAVTNTDVDEVAHTVHADADAIFTWDYERSRPALGKLYEKAKTSQWNAQRPRRGTSTSTRRRSRPTNQNQNGIEPQDRPRRHAVREVGRQGVDPVRRRVAELDAVAVHARRAGRADLHRADRRDRAVDRRQVLRRDAGDGRGPPRRGVRRATSTTKLSGHYPINAHLKMLLDDIIADSRWDMTYLGMQIMVEGLALAAFGFLHQMTTEPLLKQLLRYVMSDEARHVAFGVLSLQEYYNELDRRRDAASARSSRSRPPSACATGSCSRRCGSAWAST